MTSQIATEVEIKSTLWRQILSNIRLGLALICQLYKVFNLISNNNFDNNRNTTTMTDLYAGGMSLFQGGPETKFIT